MTPDREPFDPALDALLRAHSTETPPPSLDAAILAAAHRAAQSGPRASKPAEATSPWRWWMPLAAAATIGAIAIGVLQLLPKGPESTATVVTDTPPATRSAPQRIAPPETPAPSIAQKPAVPPPPAAPMREKRNEPPRDKARADNAGQPPDAAKSEAKRAVAPKPFPAQGRAELAAAEALSTDEWIARIRALVNENKNEDAARALNAFRSAYPDADARLPAELKAWAATVKR